MNRQDLIRATPSGPAITGPYVPGRLTTKEGWSAYAHRILEAPDLQDCAPLGTIVGDNDRRMLYHGEMLPVDTPDLGDGLLDARRILRVNRRRTAGRRTNIVIDGHRGAGKTLLLCTIGRAIQGMAELEPGAEERIPVVYIDVPLERDDTLHWSLPFADFLGIEHRTPASMREQPSGKGVQEERSVDMTKAVTRVMAAAGTELILVDNIHQLSEPERAVAFEYFFTLQDQTRASFIFCGIGAREVVHAAYQQHHSKLPRKGDTIDSELPVLWVGPVPYNEDWISVLKRIEEDLRLYKHQPGTLTTPAMAQYLHKRTGGGYMDTLNLLICQAAQLAIEDGTEAITRETLDQIRAGRGDDATK